jgi:hypothetical protein
MSPATLAFALVAWLVAGRGAPPSLPPPSRSPPSLPPSTLERFRGSLLGVHAEAGLDHAERYAMLRLSGVVLGGALVGRATFEEANGPDGPDGPGDPRQVVVLHEPLKSALARRGVKVTEVRHTGSELHVHLRLPVLGARVIVMEPVR